MDKRIEDELKGELLKSNTFTGSLLRLGCARDKLFMETDLYLGITRRMGAFINCVEAWLKKGKK